VRRDTKTVRSLVTGGALPASLISGKVDELMSRYVVMFLLSKVDELMSRYVVMFLLSKVDELISGYVEELI